MNVLVLSLYYDPDVCQSNGPIVRAICDDLAAAGHAVTVLTSFPHYNRTAVWDEYRGRFLERGEVGAVRVFRSYIYVSRRRSALARMLNYLSFNISSTLAGMFTGPQDIVFAMSPPLTIGLTGYLLGRLKGAPFCYNLQDIWPDVAVKLGMLKGRRTIELFSRIERFIYRRSTRLFAISDEFRSNLLAKGVDPLKIEVIPNFVDTDFIRPLPRVNPFAERHGLTGSFVVLYAGNLGLSQGLEVVLDAAALLQKESGIVFLIVGSGGSRDSLMADAARRNLENVRFLELQPEADVPLLYASCDVALIPLRRGISENSVPSKIYSIMASSRPYVAGVDPEGNVWRLTANVGCGVCVPAEDSRALSEALLQMRGDPERRAAMGLRGRSHVEKHFARSSVTQRYRAALEQLTGSAGVAIREDRPAPAPAPAPSPSPSATSGTPDITP